jgi:hypothetical protein
MYLLESKSSDLGTCWAAAKIRVPKSEDLDSSAVPNHTLYQKIYASVLTIISAMLPKNEGYQC